MSGQECDLSNYKLISVLSVLSRLLEKLAHDQLYAFCRTNDSFSKKSVCLSEITQHDNFDAKYHRNLVQKY